jgi:hypothetical protein
MTAGVTGAGSGNLINTLSIVVRDRSTPNSASRLAAARPASALVMLPVTAESPGVRRA